MSAVLTVRLRLPEAVGLSLSMVSPTLTAAFNIVLVVQATGPAAPLTFAIGGVAMMLVALSFVSFTHRVAHVGSAYAYVSHTFGRKAGFVAGWALLLTYLSFASGSAALFANFLGAALDVAGIEWGGTWMAVGGAAVLAAWWFAYRDMRLAGRLMLGLEAASVIGILALCVAILRAVSPGTDAVSSSFRPSADFGGWSGLGFGMAFSILSFAGFEGAATLGEETVNPRRNIPIALLGTVAGSAVFFILVAYCEIVGYGAGGLKSLANSQAPLNDLALRYASKEAAVGLDLGAAISCFAGLLGGLAAAARVLFALGRAGLWPPLARVHALHGTPATALSWAALLILAPFLLWAPVVGAANYYSYTATIGVLALILVYVGVGVAEVQEAWRERRPVRSFACLLGSLLLIGVLYSAVYPVPEYPNNLWPYVALAWVIASAAVMKYRPDVTRAPLPGFG